MAAKFQFGKWALDAREVFAETSLSYAIVNTKPVLPGHVLAVSRRVVARISELTDEETIDLWRLAGKVARVVEAEWPETTAVTWALQDGKEAGQTVPHVHVHLMPRNPADKFQGQNDEIYRAIDAGNEQRADRSLEVMAEEAARLRARFDAMNQ